MLRYVQFPLTFDLQYGIPFYLQYLAHWPEYFIVAEAPGGELMGYSKFCSNIHLLMFDTLTGLKLWDFCAWSVLFTFR